MSMLTLFESRYTSNGRYSFGNVGKTVVISMNQLVHFRSTYYSKEKISHGVTANSRYFISFSPCKATSFIYEYAKPLGIKILT